MVTYDLVPFILLIGMCIGYTLGTMPPERVSPALRHLRASYPWWLRLATRPRPAWLGIVVVFLITYVTCTNLPPARVGQP